VLAVLSINFPGEIPLRADGVEVGGRKVEIPFHNDGDQNAPLVLELDRTRLDKST